MNEFFVSLLLILIFLFSIFFRTPFVLTTVIIGTILSILHNFYNFEINLGNLKIFSDIAISLIFFSLGLGYTMDSFIKILKKSFISSLIDLINFFLPCIIFYILTREAILSLVIGLCLYPSSTAITVKILEFQKKLATRLTDLIIGILLFEDIFIIITISIIFISTKSKILLSSLLYSILILLIIYVISRKIFSQHYLILEKHLQEESGVFFIFGYFLLLHYISKIFDLPELLIVFLGAILIPTPLSNSIKSKIEFIKNLSIGIFILEFISQTKIYLNHTNFKILIMLPFLIFIKSLSLLLSLKLLNIKYKKEDIFYLLPRGEFSAYIAKLSNIEPLAFTIILLSNILVLPIYRRNYKN